MRLSFSVVTVTRICNLVGGGVFLTVLWFASGEGDMRGRAGGVANLTRLTRDHLEDFCCSAE